MVVEGDFCASGKTILVTGGDKGLGLETCRRLVAGGARVILACRDQRLFGPENERARAKLVSSLQCGPSVPEIMRLDLSSLKSVHDFSSQFKAKFSSLDVLICNAGVMTPHRNATTQDGVEIHVGVNHLAHFYLIQLLKENLLCTHNSRVVIVSSMLLKEGHLKLNFAPNEGGSLKECFQQSTGSRKSMTPSGYADSKLMNSVHQTSAELAF